MDERLLTRNGEDWKSGPPPSGSTCVDAETLAAWADGTLAPAEARAVEDHLADCARCQTMAATMAEAEAEMDAASAGASAPARAPWIQRWWLPVAGAIAATILVVVAVRQNNLSPDASRSALEQTVARTEPVPAPLPVLSPAPPPPNATLPEAKSAPATTDARPRTSRAPAPTERETTIGPVPSPVPAPPPPPPAGPPPQAAPPPPQPAPVPVQPPAVVAMPPAPPAQAPPLPTSQAARPASQLRATISNMPAREELRLMAMVEFASPAPAGGGGSGSGVGAAGRGGGVSARPESSSTRWRILSANRVVRSTDNGLTWIDVALPDATAEIINGAAPSRMVCWLVGRAGLVYRMIDGLTFARVSFPERVDLRSIVATDDLTATVTAADGRQFSTRDGGGTWQVR